jgi:hypothetical protein
MQVGKEVPTMRSAKFVFVCLIAVAGCGPEFAVVPRDGMDRAVSQMNGVTLVAFANQWAGDPYDLADYVTPIAVELYNGSPYEVRVNYADLALRDGSGFRYAAINPYIPATMYGENGPAPATPATPSATPSATNEKKPVLLAANGPMLVAWHSGGGGGGFSGGGFHASASSGYHGGGMGMHSSGGVRGGWIGPAPGAHGWGYRGGGWRGYRPIGGVRPWFGYGLGYWGGPWAYPPYYYDWVFAWGPTYYPARPSDDVLTLGLPEGVLPPGARVSGFLYFKRATAQHQGALDLAWDVHDAQTNAPLGSVHVPLEVVHR